MKAQGGRALAEVLTRLRLSGQGAREVGTDGVVGRIQLQSLPILDDSLDEVQLRLEGEA